MRWDGGPDEAGRRWGSGGPEEAGRKRESGGGAGTYVGAC